MCCQHMQFAELLSGSVRDDAEEAPRSPVEAITKAAVLEAMRPTLDHGSDLIRKYTDACMPKGVLPVMDAKQQRKFRQDRDRAWCV